MLPGAAPFVRVAACSLPASDGVAPDGELSPPVPASASCHDGIDGLPLLEPTPKRGGTDVGMDGGEFEFEVVFEFPVTGDP